MGMGVEAVAEAIYALFYRHQKHFRSIHNYLTEKFLIHTEIFYGFPVQHQHPPPSRRKFEQKTYPRMPIFETAQCLFARKTLCFNLSKSIGGQRILFSSFVWWMFRKLAKYFIDFDTYWWCLFDLKWTFVSRCGPVAEEVGGGGAASNVVHTFECICERNMAGRVMGTYGIGEKSRHCFQQNENDKLLIGVWHSVLNGIFRNGKSSSSRIINKTSYRMKQNAGHRIDVCVSKFIHFVEEFWIYTVNWLKEIPMVVFTIHEWQ